MTQFTPATALGRQLRDLTEQQVLSAEQAEQVWLAAQADRDDPAGTARSGRTAEPAEPQSSTGVLDVLGYAGGALLLGALIFVGVTLWGDLSRGGKVALSIAAFLVPATGGIVLELGRARRGLARTLLALACYAAGFACYTLFDDEDLIISAAVVVVASAIGASALRSPAFYLPGWTGAMGLVAAVVVNGLEVRESGSIEYWLAGGFLLVALALVAAGLGVSRSVAWTMAGLSGWATSIVLAGFEHSYLALAAATLVAAALFVGVVRLQQYAFAVVGCLIVLSIWPVALFQILDTALGVALGLIGAGCVLIAAAVVIARLRQRGGRGAAVQTAR